MNKLLKWTIIFIIFLVLLIAAGSVILTKLNKIMKEPTEEEISQCHIICIANKQMFLNIARYGLVNRTLECYCRDYTTKDILTYKM